MEIFGQRIKSLRKEQGLTQTQLAEQMHLDKSTIAKYETNRIAPSAELIIAFAKFFNVETDYLLGLKDF